MFKLVALYHCDNVGPRTNKTSVTSLTKLHILEVFICYVLPEVKNSLFFATTVVVAHVSNVDMIL